MSEGIFLCSTATYNSFQRQHGPSGCRTHRRHRPPGRTREGQESRGTLTGMDLQGAYTADRAAALSGVPKSTIHWWARNDILIPKVSSTKVKLWSYGDLMSLRVIYWLRRKKT